MYQQRENTCESACAGGDGYPKHRSHTNPQFAEQTSWLPSLQIEEYAAEIPPTQWRILLTLQDSQESQTQISSNYRLHRRHKCFGQIKNGCK